MAKSRHGLGAVAGATLAKDRLLLHHAVQLAQAFARGAVAEQPGDAHANLGWLSGPGAFTSRAAGGLRAALRVHDLTLALLDDGDDAVDELLLDGRTRNEALAWLREAVARRDHDPFRFRLEAPYELPHHPVLDGVPYRRGDGQGLAELARWFELAHGRLATVADAHAEASPVRTWPHHFDMATLLTLDPDADPERSRSVGVGLSPGDEHLGQPYFYVTPWPAPEPEALPPLTGPGRWHTDDFTAAVLEAPALLAAAGDDDPATTTATFLEQAVSASLALLNAR